MKFAPLTIVLLCLSFFSTTAQKNFQSAFYVNNTGDSIHGFVSIKDWEKNPESFLFRKNLDDRSNEILTIDNVRYFEVANFKYLRHLTTITMDPIKASMATVSEVQPRIDTVFLRVFQIGKNISLFGYTDQLKTRYYIVESGSDTPVELELRIKAWRDKYSVWHSGFFEGYKNQLANLAMKYGVISEKLQWSINHVGYGDDLVKITSVINGIDSKKVKVHPKPEFHLYGGLGINKSWLTYKHGGNAAYYSLADNAKSDPTTAPCITAGFDFARNRNVSKLHFNLEVMVSQMKNHTVSHEHLGATDIDLDYRFAFKTYNLSLVAQYNFYQTKNLKIFLGTGVRFTQTSYSQNSATYGGSNPTIIADPFQLTKSWVSIPGKAGLTIMQRVQLYYFYIPTFWFNNNTTTIKEYMHNYQFGVNVVF
jgi:hypothetical protein